MHILKEKTIVLKITQLFQKQALINRVVLGPVANGAIFTHVVITFSPCQIFPYYVFPFQNTAVGCPLQSQQVTVVCVCVQSLCKQILIWDLQHSSLSQGPLQEHYQS